MTLTLDEVRRVRFRLVSRGATGYRVEDVDNFIDKVEESFGSFENQIDLLKRENQAGSAAGEGAAEELAAKDREISGLRAEVDRLRNAQLQRTDDGRVAELTSQNQDLSVQNQQLGAQTQQLRSEAQQLRSEGQALRNELDQVRSQLEQARSARSIESSSGTQMITVSTTAEASPVCVRMVQLASEQAEQLVAEAEAEASRKLESAQRQAHEVTTDARTKAERIESEARVNAEQLNREAQDNAQRVNAQADARRIELFADLERQQSEYSTKVSALRSFEENYRDNLRRYVERHLGALDQDMPRPQAVPELLQQTSSTPRLDALAHEGK